MSRSDWMDDYKKRVNEYRNKTKPVGSDSNDYQPAHKSRSDYGPFSLNPDWFNSQVTKNSSDESDKDLANLHEEMNALKRERKAKRVPTTPIAFKGSGRSVAQAEGEAQDPLYEFLLDQGIIDSQGTAQKSLKERMKNQTPEIQREKEPTDNDTIQLIPTTTLEELEVSPVFDVIQDSDEDDEDNLISWLSGLFGSGSGSREEGMLTKKHRSGQVAGGKGRGLYR